MAASFILTTLLFGIQIIQYQVYNENGVMPEIGKYISYQFGNFVFNVFSVRAVLYVVLILIMLPFAKLGFKKHQVV